MDMYYIYGAAEIGKRAEKCLREKYNICISGYMDTYKKGEFNGYQIVSLKNGEKEANIIISVLTPENTLAIAGMLWREGYHNLYWFYDMNRSLQKQDSFLRDECFRIPEWDENVLVHGEFHIADNCNLNCRGCTHFSPLFDKVGASYEKRMSDLKEVKRIFSGVFRLDILGGEPLLNPELDRYIKGIRSLFPDSFLNIYSNGLLIPKLSEEVLETVADNNVAFSISEYKPTSKIIDRITDRLDHFAIRYRVVPYDRKQEFNRPISTNPHSKYPQLCISKGCITIADGLIAKCPTLMYVKKFNEKFGEDLPTKGILCLRECQDAKKTLEELEKDVPLCQHCVKNVMEWSVCELNRKFEDFATRE